MGKKRSSIVKDNRETLMVELKNLLPKLDVQGLSFLVDQARILLYNMRAGEFNKAAETVGTEPEAQKADSTLRIAGTESGSSYYLHCRGDEVMFSKDEMIRLVKIAGAEGTDMEIREHLYNWFDRERRDVFAVIPMKSKADEHLEALAALLRKTFTVRN